MIRTFIRVYYYYEQSSPPSIIIKKEGIFNKILNCLKSRTK